MFIGTLSYILVESPSILVVLGLLFDIAGAWYLVRTFIKLSEEDSMAMTNLSELIFNDSRYNATRFLEETLRGSEKDTKQHKDIAGILELAEKARSKGFEVTRKFYSSLRSDAKKGFFFLLAGFILQIIGQIFI